MNKEKFENISISIFLILDYPFLIFMLIGSYVYGGFDLLYENCAFFRYYFLLILVVFYSLGFYFYFDWVNSYISKKQ